MPPPAWAYQVDIFDPAPDEELVCCICRGVFNDPVRSPCNHVFCRPCITKWLESNRNCPFCRKRTYRSDIQEVVPLIKNMIMKLTIKCHNGEQGCQDRFTLEGCEAHLRECAFEVIRCKNKPCKEMILRRDIADHELNDCLHRYVRCKKCNLKVSSALPQKHNCVKALQKCLKDKAEIIKKKNQKIEDLQSEVRTLKENERTNSAPSSLESFSEAAIMMDFQRGVTYLSSDNSASSTSLFNSDESFSSSLFDFEGIGMLVGNESPLHVSGNQSLDTQDLDDSIELPRSYSPAEDSSPVDPITEALRRPPKRRLPLLLDDSSSDDQEGSSWQMDAFPSPKRTWSSMHPTETANGAGPSTSAGGGSHLISVRSCSAPNQVRPRSVKRPTAAAAVQTSAAGSSGARSSGTFERTLAMLSQYNLESDPEWLPGQNDSDSSAGNVQPERAGYITSSDESSLSDSSDSSDVSPVQLNLFDDVPLSSDEDSDERSGWMN